MLWKTHLRISAEAFRRLGISLSNETYSRFKDGLLAPDQWKDYPHHHGKSEAIERYIFLARQCFLQNNLLDTFYNLGVAFHYVQDSYTSVVSYDSPRNQMFHQNYEANIEDSQFAYDIENTIQYSFRNDYSQLNRYSAIARDLSRKVEGRNATIQTATLVGTHASDKTGKPRVDLNLALKASLVVAESVLSSKTSPSLEAQLKQVLLQHEDLLKKAEIETSNKVIKLIEERDHLLSNKIQPTGIVSKIKNWILGIRISLKRRSAISTSRNYFSRLHLDRVAKNYGVATKSVVASYEGWYNSQVPPISIRNVERNLLSAQEIAGKFGISEISVKELLKKNNVPNYSVDNREIVRRTELNKMLSQYPFNDFKEYPS